MDSKFTFELLLENIFINFEYKIFNLSGRFDRNVDMLQNMKYSFTTYDL